MLQSTMFTISQELPTTNYESKNQKLNATKLYIYICVCVCLYGIEKSLFVSPLETAKKFDFGLPNLVNAY